MKQFILLVFLGLLLSQVMHGQWIQQVSNTSNDLNDIFFVDDSVGFAVGQNGSFLKTLNGGQTWTLKTINSSVNLLTIAAPDPEIIYTGFDQGIYKSIDGGDSWSLVDNELNVSQLVFFTTERGYALDAFWHECVAGWGGYSGTRYRYYRTDDGGQNWYFDYSLDAYLANGTMERYKQNIGFLAGYHSEYSGSHCQEYAAGYVAKTIDGGVTWFNPGTSYMPIDIKSTSFISDSIGYLVNYWAFPTLLKTTDGMASVAQVGEMPEIAKILFANEFEGYYIKENRIEKTTSGGVAWANDIVAGSELRDICITPGYHAYVVGFQGLILHNLLDPVQAPDTLYLMSMDKDSLDFPVTPVYGSNIETLKLKNIGNAEIYVSLYAPLHFRVKAEDGTEFLPQIDSLLLLPQHDTLIDIRFQPDEAGYYVETLEITSNANNDTTIYFPLAGSAVFGLAGVISTDSVICQDTIHVIGNTVIGPGGRLTICPGTTLLITGEYALSVNEGSLIAMGEAADSIIFTPLNTSQGWDGIRINSGSGDSTILEYCRIDYGNNTFDGSGYYKGGGVYISNSKVGIRHCLVSNCIAEYGGGICIDGSHPAIENCEFRHNYADIGGGIECVNSHPLIRAGNFHHNQAYDRGGAIACEFASPIIINNKFYSNQADRGGAIWLRDEFAGNYHASLVQNLIFNNIATSGGGLFYTGAEPDIMVNTICNNLATSGQGGGLDGYNAGEHHSRGNIYYGNTPGQIDFHYDYHVISWCNVMGGWTWTGQGNIDSDPGFLYPSAGPGLIDTDEGLDWSFTSASPCYNTGIPDTTGLNAPAFDFAGNPRIIQGRMDIGAFESMFEKQLRDTAVCYGDTVTLGVVPLGPGPFSYEWSHNGEILQGADNNILVVVDMEAAKTGKYRCRITAQGLQFYSRSAVIEADAQTPQILVQPIGGLVKEGDPVTLTVSAERARHFHWYFKDNPLQGAVGDTLRIPSFSSDLQGGYRCYVSNLCGGLYSEEALLLIDPSSVKEFERARMEIWPNPAGSYVSWQLAVGSWQGKMEVTIYDLFGRVVMKSGDVISLPATLDISALAAGMYVMQVITGDGASASAKFVKKSR